MNSTKSQCEKCGAKFFTLNRKEIDCKCGYRIIVKDNSLNTSKSKKNFEIDESDMDIEDSLIEEEDSL